MEETQAIDIGVVSGQMPIFETIWTLFNFVLLIAIIAFIVYLIYKKLKKKD